MSVRDSLLAILTLGPAYGLQLHHELAVRAPHRGAVNVGQIYSTLERLGHRALVQSAGVSADGLPLYRLTPAGSAAAASWMRSPAAEPGPDWTEMLDQVLVTATVDAAGCSALVDGYIAAWRAAASPSDGFGSDDPVARAATLARDTLRNASLEWLATMRTGLSGAERPIETTRPRRGRPASAA